MIAKIYSIKDTKSGRYINLFTEATDETAKRSFDSIRKDKNTIFGLYPTDFELWSFGEFDDHEGIINPQVEYIDGGTPIEVLQQI